MKPESMDKPPTASNLLLEPSTEEDVHRQPSEKRVFAKGAHIDKSERIPHNKTKRLQGWKFTLFLAINAGVIVLFFNVGFLLYCLTHRDDGQSLNTTLFDGDCTEAHRLGVGLHLIINVLSTILLGASNFGMQCLGAPTRKDINRAHAKGLWLDIGVPSIRNLFQVPGKRFLLWFLLAFSSLPFHLLYNSAIYSTTSAISYDVFAGPGSLGEQLQSDLNLTLIGANSESSFLELYSSAKNGELERLDNQACLEAFAVTFQEVYQKLLIVTDDVGDNNTYYYDTTNDVIQPSGNPGAITSIPYAWICGVESPELIFAACELLASYANLNISLGDWIVGWYKGQKYKVQYCLAEKGEQACKLQYSFPLVMVVIAFNLVKITVLLLMWFGIHDSPILTIGDAIASFLRYPDPHAQGHCLLTKREMNSISQGTLTLGRPKTFDPLRKRWARAVSARRWTISLLFWSVSVAVCTGLLIYGLQQGLTGSNPWKQALGSPSSNTLIYGDHWPSSLLGNVLIANSPQIIFSFIYFTFNGLLTSMTLSAEWSGYAIEAKGLRVSYNPKNSQRSNYFLSIPYRYGVPLMILSTLLHWLISESLFMVGIEVWGANGEHQTENDYKTCGWSAVGILSTIMVGLVLLSGIIGLSLRRFESAMPVVASCSLAIAAACHPHFNPNIQREDRNEEGRADVDSEFKDEDISLLPVRWGAMPVSGPLGHCSFASDKVDPPQTGEKLYQ